MISNNRKRIFFIVLFSLSIVTHFILVNFANLSVWKGGGYGMYTSNHYSYNEVWIETPQGIFEIPHETSLEEKRLKFMKAMPNRQVAQRFLKQLPLEDSDFPLTLQVWEPKVDLETSQYTRSLYYEIKFEEKL